MKIGILGELTRFEELKQTLPADANIIYDETWISDSLSSFDIVFDLNFDERANNINAYLLESKNVTFILSSAFIEIQKLKKSSILTNNIFGMNCLPSFINRKVKEISYHSPEQLYLMDGLMQELNWEIAPVKDRVGMVTPRILFMIINEAYYTLQEGTASREDIDTGMKLGTNYPFGPFEWSKKIGLKKVVKMLENIYDDTRDERYKICALLKSESYV